MKHIQATLATITVANGYSMTLNEVQRFVQSGQTYRPPMALIKEMSDDVSGQHPLGCVSRSLMVAVGLMVEQDESTDARSASEVMNALIADVQKIMSVDVSRGGIAVNTEETGVREVEAEEGQPSLNTVIDYKISYRHALTDPTLAA